MERFIAWLVDLTIDRLIDWSIRWSIDWLIGWLTQRLTVWLMAWISCWLIDWFFVRLSYPFVQFASLFQLTRNNLPNHLLKKLGRSRKATNLQSGFRKTGLYPFDPENIRKSVPVFHSTAIETSIPLAEQQTRLCAISEHLHHLDVKKKDRENILAAICRTMRDQSYGEEVADASRIILVPRQKEKKTRTTDPRVTLTHGRLLTEQTFVSALAESANKKKIQTNKSPKPKKTTIRKTALAADCDT